MLQRFFILVLFTWLAWLPGQACAQHAQPGTPRAVEAREPNENAAEVVLVGNTQSSVELKQVIAELLQREGVTPSFTAADRFAPEALLAEPDGDGRVHVFITMPTPLLAKLYLRGPHGERFILRELSLRSGTDELGCESIAQVVATSSRALLHSREGLDREAARANLARDPQAASAAIEPPPAGAPTPSPTPAPGPRRLSFELGARANGGWSGGELEQRLGAGLELGLTHFLSEQLLLRERLVFEQFLGQDLHARELTAQVRTSTLLLGVDLGLVEGSNAFVLGLSAGVDLMRISPGRTRDPGWMLAKSQVDSVPVLRSELRYERSFSQLFLALAAFADTALLANRFEVRDGGKVRQVASPWRVTPGLAFTLGWHSR